MLFADLLSLHIFLMFFILVTVLPLSHDLMVLAANTKVEPLIMASAKYIGVYERDAQREGSHKHLNVRLIILTHGVISPPTGG